MEYYKPKQLIYGQPQNVDFGLNIGKDPLGLSKPAPVQPTQPQPNASDQAFQALLDSIRQAGNVPQTQVPERPHLNDTQLGISALGSLLVGATNPDHMSATQRLGLQNQSFTQATSGIQGRLDQQWQSDAQQIQAQNVAKQKRADANVDVASAAFKEADSNQTRKENFAEKEKLKAMDIQGRKDVAIERARLAAQTSPTAAISQAMVDLAAGNFGPDTNPLTNQLYQATVNAYGHDVLKSRKTAIDIEADQKDLEWKKEDRAMMVRKLAAEVGVAEDNKIIKDFMAQPDVLQFGQAVKLISPFLSIQQMLLTLQGMQNNQDSFNANKDFQAWESGVKEIETKIPKADAEINKLEDEHRKAQSAAEESNGVYQSIPDGDPRKAVMEADVKTKTEAVKKINAAIRQAKADRDAIVQALGVVKSQKPGALKFSLPSVPGMDDILKRFGISGAPKVAPTSNPNSPIQGGIGSGKANTGPGGTVKSPGNIDEHTGKSYTVNAPNKKLKGKKGERPLQIQGNSNPFSDALANL